MNKPVWPKHKPEATLHEIVLDGCYRGFLDQQIIEETCGLADKTMISFYRRTVELFMAYEYANRK